MSIAAMPQRWTRATWAIILTATRLPARVRAYLARLLERCGSVDNAAWIFASQPEHLLAYAMRDEMLVDLPTPKAGVLNDG